MLTIEHDDSCCMLCSIMIVYRVVALALNLATNLMTYFANTIAMSDRYFLAHNSKTTAPIHFKF